METKTEKRIKKKKKRTIWLIVKLSVLFVILSGALVLLFAPAFNVSEYEILGNNYYTKDEIRVMGNCQTGNNIFIGVNIRDIKERLSKDAYIESISVKRVLPGKIRIELSERKQFAALGYGEKFIVIDREGTVLRKASVNPKLPVLKGFSIDNLSIGGKISVEEEVELRQILELIDTMNETGMYFKTIEVFYGEIKAYVIDNLIVRGKATDILGALKRKIIQLEVEELFARNIERGTIYISGEGYSSYSPNID